jgi:hypothetical protein
MEAKTIQYCANDVSYLLGLYYLYLTRISGDWLAKAKLESVRRVVEAYLAQYDPQPPQKRLGPWGSGPTMEEVLDKFMEDMLEDRDDVGYYDDFEEDDGRMNAADRAICPEVFDSCWDNPCYAISLNGYLSIYSLAPTVTVIRNP